MTEIIKALNGIGTALAFILIVQCIRLIIMAYYLATKGK